MRCMAKPAITIDKWMQQLPFQQYYWKSTLCQHLQQQKPSTLGFFFRNLFHALYWQLHSYKPSSIIDIDTAGSMTLGCWQKFTYVACSNLSALLQHQAHLCIWFLLHRIVLRQELLSHWRSTVAMPFSLVILPDVRILICLQFTGRLNRCICKNCGKP